MNDSDSILTSYFINGPEIFQQERPGFRYNESTMKNFSEKEIRERFGPFAEKMRTGNMPETAIEAFRRQYIKLLRGETGLLPRGRIEPVDAVHDAGGLDGFAETGVTALEKAVVIKLNGGLGSSMGMQGAKSLIPVKKGLTFLDITVRQVLEMRGRYGTQLPLVLMNSYNTEKDSIALLSRYPEVQSEVPPSFLQHKVPKISRDTLEPVDRSDDPENEWCPPGHGDLYLALKTSGVLQSLLKHGYEYAFISNVDNLGAVLEPRILGYFAVEGLPFMMEVADRSESDAKGGHLAQTPEGRPVLRELAQCPDEELLEFQDIAVYRYFNTNNIWVNLSVLDAELRERDGILDLPLIRNRKTVISTDRTSEQVYHLETAMGAAISVFPGAQALRVSRSRFAPVKTTDDLLAVWSDLYVCSESWQVVPAAGRQAGDIRIELDPVYFKFIEDLKSRFPSGPPSLKACRKLVVKGDIRFGRDIVCREEVVLLNKSEKQAVIPDGTELTGEVVLG